MSSSAKAARGVLGTLKAGAAKLRPLAERRRFGRIKGGNLRCNRGMVVDLSGGGMRLRCGRRLKGVLTVELATPTRQVVVRAEVVWSSRAGFRKYDHGLEFRDVTEEITRELTHFAAYLRAG